MSARNRERAAWVYGLLLRLYPRAHRQAFGEQMLQTFRDAYHDAVEGDGERASLFWLGVLGDAGKSLVHEHAAAIRERIGAMKRAFVRVLMATALLASFLLAIFPLAVQRAVSMGQQPGPAFWEGVPRFLVALLLLGLTLGGYGLLVVTIVSFVRTHYRSGTPVGWGRLGLAIGALFSLYAVVSNALGVLLPASETRGPGGNALLSTLPLLVTGVVGVIGGYASGTVRVGTFVGLLAGFLYLVVSQLSWALAIALAWNALRHNLLSSGVEADLQRYTQALGHVPSLGTFLSLELFEDGIGFPLVMGLLALTLEGLCATAGGGIGASLRRSDAGMLPHTPPVRPVARLASSLFPALVLGVLVWTGAAEFNALGGAHALLSPGALAWTLANPNCALWLIGLLFVLGSARFTRPRSEARIVSG